MELLKIDIERHRDIIINFRRNSFKASFGHSKNFNEAEYLDWMERKVQDFQNGFILIKDNYEYIGQMELTVRKFEGREIGYINLYYLSGSHRGKGYAEKMHEYTLNHFRNHNLEEYHLRVSPTNRRAINFYEKIGMEKLYEEFDGKVVRMRGFL